MNEWIKMLHIHNRILFSCERNKILINATKLMQLEILMLNTISHPEKDQKVCCPFVYGS